MIAVVIRQRVEEQTWVEGRGPIVQADATVAGRTFTVRCRHAAPALARQLVAAGLADQRIELRTVGVCGRLDARLFDLAGVSA